MILLFVFQKYKKEPRLKGDLVNQEATDHVLTV